MYASHFGLRGRPFRTTPDTDTYYPATSHEVALAELRRGFADEEGILLLTGEPGSGKTLLAHRLLEEEIENTRTVLITSTLFATRADLLQAILFDLDLPYQERSEQELRLELIDSCLNYFRQGGRTFIVVDEAHHLANEHLEELRLLSNLEGNDGKAVQVLLAGLPALLEKLTEPALEILRQRLTTRAKLESFSPEESVDYLLHHVRISGGRPEQVFGEDVLDILSHASHGNPRILNQAAHLAFSLAQQAGSQVVDAEAAVEAVTRLGLDRHDEESEEPAPPEPAPIASVQPIADPAPLPLSPTPTRPPLAIAPTTPDGPPTYIYGDDLKLPEDSPGPGSRWGTPQGKAG